MVGYAQNTKAAGRRAALAPEADRVIREEECARISGLSRTTRWRLEREGKFPRRRRIADSAIGWLMSEVLAWRDAKMAPAISAARKEDVLACLTRRGPMTADECAAALGLDILSIRPRFSELSRLGLIKKTGEQRPNRSGDHAAVWRLTAAEAGQASRPGTQAATAPPSNLVPAFAGA